MWQKLMKSDRNPQLVGEFVQVGRTLNDKTVFIKKFYREYEEDISNLSREFYKDGFGNSLG